MRTQKQQQHLFRFRLPYISHRVIVYLKSIFAYPTNRVDMSLRMLLYPGPDALSLVAAEADALCLGTGTFLS